MMISPKEYDKAVQVIADYNLQLDQQIKTKVLIQNPQINIQEEIKENAFRLLQKYYHAHYVSNLQWEDLKVMDRHLLETIDYDKMKRLKGYKPLSLSNLKKLMISHSILNKEEL